MARLRALGAKRVTLKTGAYPMRELAMALKWSSDAGIDLLTIDGASGGTGMSPWRMMVEWGVPTIYLEAMTYELCGMLAKRGRVCSRHRHWRRSLDRGPPVQGVGHGVRPFVKAVMPGSCYYDPGYGRQEYRQVA